MANFLSNKSSQEVRDIQPNDILLEIMRKEFPDNPTYQEGRLLQSKQPAKELQEIVPPEFDRPSRNSRNVLQCNVSREEHIEYTMRRVIPTVDTDTLDDLLDDEWETFIEDEVPIVALETDPTNNIFLINPVNPLTPVDYHDAYLTRGPQTIPESGNVEEVFCVFYIRNNIAYPIPNYKTLEVMLVERGLTYSDINEATSEQLRQFDMSFDGETSIANETVDPFGEFTARAVVDRSTEWTNRVRFDSGYKPGAPFKRDPGDYFDASTSTYFEKAYQAQTLLEGFRARFEGRMVVLSWPNSLTNTLDAAGTAAEFNAAVTNNDNSPLNDLVNSVRIMTNGYWKQVTDAEVFRAYAYAYNINLQNFVDESPRSVNDAYETDDRYQVAGYINQLIAAGGIVALQAENVDDTARNGDDIVWNSFPHIVEADRMDILEFQEYINNFSNAGEPFTNEILELYEPEGSIKYYDENRLADLEAQALDQNAIDAIVPIIYDKFEEAAAIVSNTAQTLNSVQQNLAGIVENTLGIGEGGSDIQKIILSSDKWKYVKKKRTGIKTKESENSLFRLIEKSGRVTLELNSSEEDDLAGNWCRVPEIQSSLADDVESLENAARATGEAAVAAGVGAAASFYGSATILSALPGLGQAYAVFKLAQGYSTSVANDNEYALPRRFDNTRNAALMRTDDFVISCIANAVNDTENPNRTLLSNFENNLLLYKQAQDIDELKNELLSRFNDLKSDFETILDRIEEADNVDTFISILSDINEIIRINEDLIAINAEITTFSTNLNSTITNYVKDMYNSIQLLRKRVQNKVGNQKKFAIEWPASAAAIVQRYVPGATFDNYMPS